MKRHILAAGERPILVPAHVRVFFDRIYRINYISICAATPAAHAKALRDVAPRLDLTAKEQRALQRLVPPWVHGKSGCCSVLPSFDRHGRPSGIEGDMIVLQFQTGNADLSIVTHEAWHAWEAVANIVGINLQAPGAEEPTAYYLQWLFREVLGW